MADGGYYLDLYTFSLEKLRALLTTSRLLPSQQILLEDIDARFACLQGLGIENLAQLQKALKTKTAVTAFAAQTGLPVDYLAALRREVNSYQPKPIKLADFPGVAATTVQALEQRGIKNTRQLYPFVLTPNSRRELAAETGLDERVLLELTKLADVARLKWVGPKFARLVVASPYDTVQKIAAADYGAFYEAIRQVNAEKNLYKGGLGLEDMKMWIEVVVPLAPQVVEY